MRIPTLFKTLAQISFDGPESEQSTWSGHSCWTGIGYENDNHTHIHMMFRQSGGKDPGGGVGL